MKTNKLIAAAFAALAAVSCVKDDMGGAESKTYQASFTDGLPSSKATIAVGQDASLVSWETSDRVGIMYGGSNVEYKADQAGSRSTLSAVSASADASEVWALLPYNASATLSGGVINTTLPAEQPAKAGGSFHHLAVAHSTSASLAFSNVCGLVRVKVTTEGITKVVFAGKSNEKVAGNIAITVADCSVSGADASSVALVPAEGAASIAVGDYFLAVLPQTFRNGFTVTAYKGETAVLTKDVAGSVTLSRSGIVAGTIAEVTISGISSTVVTKGETVKITGTGFSTTAAENVVKVGDIACAVTAASATELSVTVPEGLSKQTDYKFSVTVKGAEAVESEPFRYYQLWSKYTAETLISGSANNVYDVWYVGFGSDGKLWTAYASQENAAIAKLDVSSKQLAVCVSKDLIGTNKYPYGGDISPLDGSLHLVVKGTHKLAMSVPDATENAEKWQEYDLSSYGITLNNPIALHFDKDGGKYVADRDNRRIVYVHGTESEIISLDFQPYSLEMDAKGEYLYIGTNGAYKLCRMNVATKNVEVVAGKGTAPGTDTFANHGTAGNTLSAYLGSIPGIYCDVDGYIYFLDQSTSTLKKPTFKVLIPGVGDNPANGIIKCLYGPNDGAFGVEGGMLTKGTDGYFYISAKSKYKLLRIK